MSILYIDDDADDREIFKEAMSVVDAGIICSMAGDGSEGFLVLEGLTIVPDFIFVDVNMPGVGGKQFLGEVKRIRKWSSIPIVMYSTTSHESEMKEYLKLGAFSVLVKPGSFDEVCKLISSVIMKHQVSFS